MAGIINDLQDRNAKLALSYGEVPVKGYLTKHRVEFVGLTKQVRIQQAVGQASWLDRNANIYRGAGWQGIKKLYYGGEEINSSNYHFHSGGPSDAPDAYFPEDKAHPEAAYYSAELPDGMGEEDRPDRMIGIFETLKVPNFNGAGQQIDSNGDPLPGGANPYDYYFYSASPARVVMDLRDRARRSPLTVNYPAWVDWRDYCAESINWDDGALTPHQVSLEASAGGSLAPGTYWVRIATLKGGDVSSASKDRASDGITTASVVISGGNLQFTVTWASQLARGATGYRVYVGTSEDGQDKFFTVSDGATNFLLVSTLSGASTGTPPNIATGSLLRQIPRFLAMPFFVPPFDFSTSLDRIAEITCMDFHYANGKQVFLTPEIRGSVFELNLSRANTFRTWQVDRRQKPNMIIGVYRDLDDEFLSEAEPVVVTRPALQAVEGDNALTINFGTAYRSQVERGCHYWARRLIDSDQMLEIFGSPKTYHVLPGDVVDVTHDVPNWSNVEFMIEEKEEQEDTKAGYQLRGRIYGAWYSDTDTAPLPRPLPEVPLNPFAAPPLITGVTLTEDHVVLANTTWVPILQGGVEFAPFIGQQRGRVWHWAPNDSQYRPTSLVLIPEPSTLESAFEIRGADPGLHKIKIVTESSLGVSQGLAAATEYTITIEGPPPGVAPAGINGYFNTENDDLLLDWEGDPTVTLPLQEVYDLQLTTLADTSFAAIKAAVVVIPLLLAPNSHFVPLEILSPPGSLNPAQISLDDHGVKFTFNSSDLETVRAFVWSAPTAAVTGGLYVEFECPPEPYWLPFQIYLDQAPGSFGFSPATQLGWARVGVANQEVLYIKPFGAAPSFRMIRGDRYGILIRPDGVVEYYHNYLGPGSTPIFISPRRANMSVHYRLLILEEFVGQGYPVLGVQSGVNKIRWIRQVPEYTYGSEAQELDFGSLPDDIRVRVRQRSQYLNGPPSDWTEELFTRP